MFPLRKFTELSPGQRRRKLALLLAAIEKELAEARDTENPQADSPYPPEYIQGIAALVIEDPKIDPAAAASLETLLLSGSGRAGMAEMSGGDRLLKLCNTARHALLAAIGTFPAEWDLIHPEREKSGPVSGRTENAAGTIRPCFSGIQVYAEDIRSPFNLGSIFRTAEAFGAEKLFLSPLCVSPDHPRAMRSAMGSVGYLPWERLSLGALPRDIPVFALETGGTSLSEFKFPEKGIVIIGSEELGVSPEGLERAEYGRVSIPMTGIKASLNVGVAFGILMERWISYTACSAENPS
ncbi:TrmH family RNA methyltransferase [Brucepastera parasyntrophica]|uniref:TrmH family RNA methyltransferase n=1 Tax=Brucepastera parasyntrophica TaxID=2880008 RepID=UPI002109FA7E|nr:TrmH family RNA methyltransferase [Brucepastera parasyntrophica]ULQ58978.1 TrmH family RNA methyltransferase [Brucepastera parasyntrophica]